MLCSLPKLHYYRHELLSGPNNIKQQVTCLEQNIIIQIKASEHGEHTLLHYTNSSQHLCNLPTAVWLTVQTLTAAALALLSIIVPKTICRQTSTPKPVPSVPVYVLNTIETWITVNVIWISEIHNLIIRPYVINTLQHNHTPEPNAISIYTEACCPYSYIIVLCYF